MKETMEDNQSMASTAMVEEEQMMDAAADHLAAAVNTACGEQVSSAAVSTSVDAAEKNKLEGNRKKMKEIMMPQSEVDYVLSYDPETCDPETEAWLKAFDPELYALGEREDRRMLAEQENFKRQIALKGYVSMMVEVTDDDEEDEDEEEDDEEEDYVLDHETLEEHRNY